MDAFGVDVVLRRDEVLDAAMDGSKLSGGKDVFSFGDLRRGRPGAPVNVDFFV